MKSGLELWRVAPSEKLAVTSAGDPSMSLENSAPSSATIASTSSRRGSTEPLHQHRECRFRPLHGTIQRIPLDRLPTRPPNQAQQFLPPQTLLRRRPGIVVNPLLHDGPVQIVRPEPERDLR